MLRFKGPVSSILIRRLKLIVNVLNFQTLQQPAKRPRQTDQTEIRLLMRKQCDQGLHCLLFRQIFY